MLVIGALLERDKKVMLADPGYPCNRHFARFVEGQAQSIAVDESSNYQLTATHINEHWDNGTAMALLASPSNPTGTVLSRQQLTELSTAIKAIPQGAFYIYANCKSFLNEAIPDSMTLCQDWLQKTGVAVTPADDFGDHLAEQHIRFVYTVDQQRLLEAIDRINHSGK